MKLTQFTQIGPTPIYHDDLGAVCFKSGLMVDADGSPHAYAPDSSGLTALDYLGNAGSPGNWWGIATDASGSPYTQSAWHPAPGFYISTTALANPNYPAEHPAHYLDSERYCFFVLPGDQSFAKLGDVGLALNTATGDNMYFAIGDVGPKDQIGEGSILLARCLGLNPSPKTGGTAKRIISYLILPNSDPGYSDWETKCKLAINLVQNWGGVDRLTQLSPMLA